MSRKQAVLQAVIDAWCERQDIDAVLEHMTDDIVWHFSAVSVPPKTGKAGAREFLTVFKEKVRNPAWRIFSLAESDTALFVEGADAFEDAEGRPVIVPYMGILEFRGEKICGWRDYFDRGSADGGNLPDHARPLIERPVIMGPKFLERSPA